jgi:hypothetical protein
MISPDAANMGVKASYVFAGLLVPVTILVYFFYPEVSSYSPKISTFFDCHSSAQTTGRTYVELDELYRRGIPARKFKSTTTSTESRGLKSDAIITHTIGH